MQEENRKGQWRKRVPRAKEQIEQEEEVCEVTQPALSGSCFVSMAQIPWSVTLPVPILWLLRAKTTATCDSLSNLLWMLLHSTVLPSASAKENKQALSWAMRDTLNSSLRPCGGTTEIHF